MVAEGCGLAEGDTADARRSDAGGVRDAATNDTSPDCANQSLETVCASQQCPEFESLLTSLETSCAGRPQSVVLEACDLVGLRVREIEGERVYWYDAVTQTLVGYEHGNVYSPCSVRVGRLPDGCARTERPLCSVDAGSIVDLFPDANLGDGCAAMVGGGSVALSKSAAAEVTDQCSRGSPEWDSAFDPTLEELNALECSLPELETFVRTSLGFDDFVVGEYFRQYVGLVQDGNRVVYVNAMRASLVPAEWYTKPVRACDGGRSFFGVVFDLELRRFRDVDFNGSLLP